MLQNLSIKPLAALWGIFGALTAFEASKNLQFGGLLETYAVITAAAISYLIAEKTLRSLTEMSEE